MPTPAPTALPPLPPPESPGPLAYESSVAGALEPGERIVWEGRAAEAPPQAHWRGAVAALLIVPLALTILVALGTANASAAVAVGVLSMVPFGIIVGVMIQSDRQARRRREHGLYRVTDRRIQRVTSLPGGESAETTFDELAWMSVERGPQREDLRVTFDEVTFDSLADPERVQATVLEQWSRTARRAKIRRTPPALPLTLPSPPSWSSQHRSIASMHSSFSSAPPAPPLTADAPPAPPAPALPDGLLLAPDEVVLWTGKPKVWPTFDRHWALARLKGLAWLLIPVSVIAHHVLRVPQWQSHNYIFVVLCVIWLLAAGWAMTVDPFVAARRRRRTTYVLTNIRGITHLAGRRSRTSSALLDMASSATLEQHGDGTGDVWITVGGGSFERIANPEGVYQIALEAIRRAGTPVATGSLPPTPPPATVAPAAPAAPAVDASVT